MPWVKRAHDCLKPTMGSLGDLWRCEICGRLWLRIRVTQTWVHYWTQAHWWQKLWYRGK